MILGAEVDSLVGEDTFLSSNSPINNYGVVFEDDMQTGYFYAVDTEPKTQVLDALHIYGVEAVADREKISRAQIAWTDDGMVASLLINNYCHAIFDFSLRAGYCRNGFPENQSNWTTVEDRTLTDEMLEGLVGK